jgi:putative endonuclease
MFYAYVLKSLQHNFLYKGHCENVDERLSQHNSGMTKSIKPYLPFELIYVEEFGTREEAISREKYLKTAAGRRFLKKKLNQ